MVAKDNYNNILCLVAKKVQASSVLEVEILEVSLIVNFAWLKVGRMRFCFQMLSWWPLLSFFTVPRSGI
ncbi:hypothetical protein TorRG33x02_224660 [Trema orientale]|uniref:Uncharacterized protein n=1 Tax=Trema orientale TaxID=63057 RepID=A0A2P5E8B3_TREOI|nr:hypothetical protein TorRG33x02_224660 [Trema orientale]